jgi:hypothetical protein
MRFKDLRPCSHGIQPDSLNFHSLSMMQIYGEPVRGSAALGTIAPGPDNSTGSVHLPMLPCL